MSSRHLALPLAAALLAAGCTANPGREPGPAPSEMRAAPAIKLVGYQADCRRLTEELRKAAQESVGPWGLGGGMRAWDSREAASADLAYAGPAAKTAEFSGTNNHEAGADEPDLVKTDGRRVVTVDRGVLRVVDAAARAETGRLDLGVGQGPADLLLAGDRALVLAHRYPVSDVGGGAGFAPTRIAAPGRVELLLVDLTAAKPRVLSRYGIDASLVDARQTGTTARVVVRSGPQILFEDVPNADADARLKANRRAIAAAPVEAWLPRYDIITDGRKQEGRVGCERVHTPPSHSGASLVTVLTFDLSRAALDTGEPVTVAADGETVYGTPTSLYVANDERWRQWRRPDFTTTTTELYRFDITGARAEYRAAGKVPGHVLNQYALSEWDGHLRVATTTGLGDRSQSEINVLRLDGGALTKVGRVAGLGKTEQIHAVRFIEDRGYVVTFRQTDPLYTLDLADPAEPRVTGELKIPGYSAHLQPLGPGRLVGIGQDADHHGVQRGTQVSLFDVQDPAAPSRLAQHRIRDAWSEAEADAHAVLWWPATKLLVVPVQRYADRSSRTEALALRVGDAGLTRIGEVTHPGAEDDDRTIRRTLVVGTDLWTVSGAGLQANDLGSLRKLAWLPA